MRVFFLGNNYLACEILKWLKRQNDEIVGLVLHPTDRQRYGKKIREIAKLPRSRVFMGTNLRDPKILKKIVALKADITVSILFGYILKPDFLDLFPQGSINLHLGYLPYNRGAFPNVWCFLDKTPAGVTLHYMDHGVDTGPIIAQKEVPIAAVDTGATLYKKLEKAAVEIFKKNWKKIKKAQATTLSQSTDVGTSHRVADSEFIDRIDLHKSYQAGALIDLLRARTFPPYRGAYFLTPEGKKIYIQIELTEEDE